MTNANAAAPQHAHGNTFYFLAMEDLYRRITAMCLLTTTQPTKYMVESGKEPCKHFAYFPRSSPDSNARVAGTFFLFRILCPPPCGGGP